MQADYVIVGAGSAGCVLAERLSRDPRNSVILIEAGGSDRRFWVQVPLGYGRLFRDPRVNWMYETEPDPGLGGQSAYWPRGKLLGGSSSINAMVYIRGARSDYDAWADEGNTGWAWRDVASVYAEIEANSPKTMPPGVPDGINVQDVSYFAHPMARRLFAAAQELQIPPNADFNGESQEGVGCYRITTTPNGMRHSAARAFLWPARSRKNLTILTGAMAERVIFDGLRAVAVDVRRRGDIVRVNGSREIIISAGAVGTPQLMQLSGVGPAEHLKSLGLDVVLDQSNVGGNLQDHLGINYYYRSRQPTLNQLLAPWAGRIYAGLQYLLQGRGPLALSINQTGGFFRSSPKRDKPNMQLYFQGLTTLMSKGLNRPLLAPDPFPAFALGISNCCPKSRGEIRLRTSDPSAQPSIQPNSFSHPDDIEEMIEAVKLLRRLSETPAFQEVIEMEVEPGPGCVGDQELEADIRERSGTVYHPSCTCRMAPMAADGVVDARLRVHGLQGLRIADASVFPSVPSGNTNAPSMMVGAKAGQMVLADAAGVA